MCSFPSCNSYLLLGNKLPHIVAAETILNVLLFLHSACGTGIEEHFSGIMGLGFSHEGAVRTSQGPAAI